MTKNLERKKKEKIKGRTNRRRPIFNPSIQRVVINLYTKYEQICGDIFDEKVLWNYGRTDGRTDGTTDRCKPVYPPLFQSGGIIRVQGYCDVYKRTILKRSSPEVKCLYLTSSRRGMCTLSVSNVIYHKFSHGAAFYTLHGKNVNVMLELTIQLLCASVFVFLLLFFFFNSKTEWQAELI